ncbi:hypothetical protein [Streptomyces sclerotialus]|uniref:hypothetical protein n=1 Tax=Streptomyces sclerotialus TaxID=1957 RepID=UPI0018CB7DB2
MSRADIELIANELEAISAGLPAEKQMLLADVLDLAAEAADVREEGSFTAGAEAEATNAVDESGEAFDPASRGRKKKPRRHSKIGDPIRMRAAGKNEPTDRTP